jgi:hypothetical protein
MPSLGIDVKNEARVHLWYKSGISATPFKPYHTLEEAVDSWPTTGHDDGGAAWSMGITCIIYALDLALKMFLMRHHQTE